MTDTRPLRPGVTVWGIRDTQGRPHIRQANDVEMERMGLALEDFQPWGNDIGGSMHDALKLRRTSPNIDPTQGAERG